MIETPAVAAARRTDMGRLVLLLGVLLPACAAGPVRPSDPRVAVMGRTARPADDRLRIGYPGVTLRVAFEGPSLAMRVTCSTAQSRVAVLVDGGEPRVLQLPQGDSLAVLAQGLGPGPHFVDVVHRTETWQGIVTVRAFVPAASGKILTPAPWPQRRMLFIGDSVTCGEAIDRPWGPPAGPHTPPRRTPLGEAELRPRDTPTDCQTKQHAAAGSNAYLSYGMLLARALGAQVHLVCYGGRGLIRDWRGNRKVLDAPRFFDAAVPDDRAPPPWDHATYLPDVVVVSLGTNDFNLDLGALPQREEYVTAYVAFVRAIRARYPRAAILLTEGAIVSDDTDPQRPQRTVLRDYIAETVKRAGDAGVRAVPAQHYPGDACNPHPTREQHAAMARDLEPAIREATGWR